MLKQAVNLRGSGTLGRVLCGFSITGVKFGVNVANVNTLTTRFNSTAAIKPATPIYNQLSDRDTFKHVLSRKTFLIDYYKYLNDNNAIILYVHHNNINKAENAKIRSDIKNAGGRLNIIKNSLYKVYLRNEEEADPASRHNKKSSGETPGQEHPLAPLLNGPTGIITIPTCEPSVVSAILKILKSANDKAFLIGARVETSVFDIAQVDQFKDLPNQQQLQSQLAGLLTILGGAGLVQTLQASSTNLYLTMEERRKDIDPDSKTQE
jgi:large subunit ribosomal protein L10